MMITTHEAMWTCQVHLPAIRYGAVILDDVPQRPEDYKYYGVILRGSGESRACLEAICKAPSSYIKWHCLELTALAQP